MFTSRFRFDNDTFDVKRTEIEARANFDRWSGQPALRRLRRATRNWASSTGDKACWEPGQVKLDANWVLIGAARYDINAGKFDQTRIGVGYVDDCLILGLNYITNYTYSGNVSANHTIMLQLSLRTFGWHVGRARALAGRAQSAATSHRKTLRQWTL